jgi:hypothetical protein
MEAATRSGADPGAGNSAGKVALSDAGTADQHGIAPEEGASGEITYQALIDWPPAVRRTVQELGASLSRAFRATFCRFGSDAGAEVPVVNMAETWSE